MENAPSDQLSFQANQGSFDTMKEQEEQSVQEQPSHVSQSLDVHKLSPSNAVHELVQKTMLACFVREPQCSRTDREQLLRDVQQLTRVFARKFLLPPDEESFQQAQDSQAHDGLPRETAVPPWAYFSFQDNGRMHLPIIDWSAFRGYSVALWINVEFGLPTKTADPAKFTLFRFTNGSNTLGVEASLESTDEASHEGHSVLLNVSCCAPSKASEAKKSASIAASSSSSSYSSEWRRLQQHLPSLVPGKWHLVVISHSLHYVKKSKVTCYVDTKLQFEHELVYPTGLATASKCTVGGGRNAHAKVASVSMYHDELAKGTIDFMYTLGPVFSSFTRWSAALPAPSSRILNETLENSPLEVPVNDAFAAYCKLQVVFSFNAQDRGHEDYADLGVEWLCEGIAPSPSGKWLTFESTLGTSAEIQQRNARLGKHTCKCIFPAYSTAWDRHVGITALPVLLDYLLTAYERVQKSTFEDKQQGEHTSLPVIMESLVVDLLWILKGLLCYDVANQQEVVKKYVFHVLAYVLVQHPACLAVVWTPRSLVVCVEMVQSLMTRPARSKKALDVPTNHPFHVSIWTTDPVFASAVRALLFDYRLWTHVDFKTQSIYNHQLYRLACEYPRAFNNLDTVSKVLEILATFYAASPLCPPRAASEKDLNSHQLTAQDDKEHQWKQQSVQSLVEVMEVCLTNQSTQFHDVLEQEVMETTFARASTSNGGPGGATTNANNPMLSTPPSSTSAAASITGSSRKGGVFCINLESIVWSDQRAGGTPLNDPQDGVGIDKDVASGQTSVLTSIDVRFSLVRDMRAIIRFLLTSTDAAVCTSLLLMLRRLAVSFVDMRVAMISSCMMDCLLYLMHAQDTRVTDEEEDKEQQGEDVAVSVRMASLPLFIYLVDWLESIEGRTVWCGLEDHLRWVFKGQNNVSVGFLELMLEFYFDPAYFLGIQHSLLMNDPPSKHDSLLFPIASASNKPTTSKTDDDGGIAVLSSSLDASSERNTGLFGAGLMMEWMKTHRAYPPASFGNKRLQLTWEKRLAVLRLMALRSLSHVRLDVSVPCIAELFDEGVSGILSLPLTGILPFLPILLGRTSPVFREKVLMDLNVQLKTDETLQHQVLGMHKAWALAFVELSLTCSVKHEEDDEEEEEEEEEDEMCTQELYGRAYSFDANRTGEDLVLDTIVSVVCMAMTTAQGYRALTHVLVALREMHGKYNNDRASTGALSSTFLPPLATVKPNVQDCQVFSAPLTWMCRVVGIVLQRLARSRTILSRVLAENIHYVLILVDESLVTVPGKQTLDKRVVWSDAQLFVLQAVLEMCTRLVESRHKIYRQGLAPGLQILQRALPYLAGHELLARVVSILTQTFQQQVTHRATLSIDDAVPTRVVFLRALTALRRALLVHQDDHVLALLRGLTLKICTSGLFDDELGAAGVSVHELSEYTEVQAVEVVLNTLALVINDNEGHEREEAEDKVLVFPMARELLRLQEGDDNDDNAAAAADATEAGAGDENERVLWAALEVEENRMLATLRHVTTRETQRARTAVALQNEQKHAWTHKLWLQHEWTFRSQHAHAALHDRAPETLTTLLATRMWRLGRYETPFPSRTRWTVDLELQLSHDKKLLALETEEGGSETTHFKHEASLPRRASAFDVLTLPIEMFNNEEGPSASEKLLERVGRVIAEQRGGEIHDITSDEALSTADTYVASPGNVERSSEVDVRSVEESTEAYKCPPPPGPGKEEDDTSCSSSSQTTWSVQQEAAGLDPGPGVAVTPDEQVYAHVTCRRVVPEGIILGRLSLCATHMAFEPLQDAWHDVSLGLTRSPRSAFDDPALFIPLRASVEDAAPGLHRCWRWKYTHLVGIYLRRYRLRDSGLELFLENGSSHFLDLPLTTKQRRNDFVRVLYSFVPRSIPKQWPGRVIPHLQATTKAWQARQMSNFDYLMALNTFAGRSFNDLTQYPVFPWILADYHSATLDLTDPLTFRDLSKPVGALNPTRLAEYWDRYHSFDDPVIPKFLYGSHYSTCAGVVLFFLFRLEPFASLHRKMQGGCFDLSDRLFVSLAETWHMCNSHMSEVKELTPEFFASDGSFLWNRNGYDLGKRHDATQVHDVELPKWAQSPQDFIRLHRAALESDYVSCHLHAWIDLIFGYKQRGRAALQADNVFYYLTYYGVVDLDHVDDPALRESMELQIAHFGQCPMQLFATPHPARSSPLLPSKTSTLSSPGGNGGKSDGGSALSSLPRPLSLAFQDVSPLAQAKRRQWSPLATVQAIAPSSIRLVKTFPDRIVSVNDLGVIELYYWKLLPKPAATASTASLPLSPRGKNSTLTSPVSPGSMKAAEASETTEALLDDCPWLLEVVRDDSPFEYVPRLPVFDAETSSTGTGRRTFPVVMSRNGRVLVAGGARNGALHFRLLDLDNGHVVGKASVVGHSAAVSCLSLDRWTAHSHQPFLSTAQDDDDDELLVSGSFDGTVAVWRLSRLKPDLLFRLPRVSPRPIQVLRGHTHAVIDCCVSTFLGVVVSCSAVVGMVHFLYDDGPVAFVFEPAEAAPSRGGGGEEEEKELVYVRLSIKGYVVALTRCEKSKKSILQLLNLSGTVLQSHELGTDPVVDVQISAEGDLLFLTLASGIIRLYRLEDFVLVQEYTPPGTVTATCFGPREAVILLACGHEDGMLSLQLLPDATGAVSFLATIRRLLGVSAKLKRVKGTVQQAQTLALSTLGNAKAVTSTARDIAGEALGEAKVLMRGLLAYWQKD